MLCIHRFDFRVEIEHFNIKAFNGWSDLRIFTYFLGHILVRIGKGVVSPAGCVFVILTKDRNFTDDVKKEWEETDGGKYLDLIFSSNSISWGGLVVFVQQIDCRNSGSQRSSDLKCIFHKVNDFLAESRKA